MKKKLLIVLLLGLISISITGCLSMLFPEPNNPPVITSTSIETATVGEDYTYTVEATDPDGDDLTYFLTTNPSTGMAIDENSGVISWAPITAGSYDVTVEVSDGKLSDVQSFTITVSEPEPTNQAPLITSIPVTSVILRETYTYAVEATDSDGDALTYSLTAKPSGMTIDGNTGVITWAPITTGSYDVTVEVSDGKLSDVQSFTITVSEPEPTNQAPLITSIPVTSVILRETYTCTVEATDPDGDTLTYSFAACPVGMTINSTTGAINWTPTALGNFGVTVKVSDGKLSDIRSFTIIVSPVPVGPTIVFLSPLEAIVGELYTGQVTATPGSNATLAFSLIGAPAGMTINSITGLINWIPAAAGEQTVTIVVIDGLGLSDSKDFTIIVNPANQAPVITPITDATVTVGETFTYTVEATDPDGDTLTYSLTDSPAGMTIDENIGTINWSPTAAGSFGVTVEVSDGKLTATQRFVVESIKLNRVVMAELFIAPACSRCPRAKGYMAQLLQEYGFSQLVVLEEYAWNYPLSTGWATQETSNRYHSYIDYLGVGGATPDAYFNGLSQFVHHGDDTYSNYKTAIEAELNKPPKVFISASYYITGNKVNISGSVNNISSTTLNNIVIGAMVYEDNVPLVIPDYNIDTIANHVVRDIITSDNIGIFSPGETTNFSLISDSLWNLNLNNIHVVVYVQAPNSPTKEILQALYVE